MRPSFRKIDQKESDHLQQAIKLLGQLQQENPTVPEYRRMLALCYREQFHAGDTEAIGRAVKSLNELVEQYPHVDDYRYDLAVTTAASAWVESEDIESILRGAIEHARQLDLNSPTYAVALADMNSSLAIHLVRSASEANDPNSLDEAQEMLEEAVRIHTGLVKANPDNASYRGRAANSLQGLARFIVERSDDEDNLRRAESLLARAAKQLDVLVAHRDTNPTLTGLHWPLARIHERRADYLTLLSQFEQAQRASAKAAAHREKLEKWRSHRYRQGRRK